MGKWMGRLVKVLIGAAVGVFALILALFWDEWDYERQYGVEYPTPGKWSDLGEKS
jgi:hypothetical protein